MPGEAPGNLQEGCRALDPPVDYGKGQEADGGLAAGQLQLQAEWSIREYSQQAAYQTQHILQPTTNILIPKSMHD